MRYLVAALVAVAAGVLIFAERGEEKRGLSAGVPHGAELEQGIRQLANDYGTGHVGYDGPCPPSGTHRYVFTLYALDTTLDVSSRGKLHGDMKDHVLAQAQLIGKYAAKSS